MINQWNLLNARLILVGDYPGHFDTCDMDAKKYRSVKKSRNKWWYPISVFFLWQLKIHLVQGLSSQPCLMTPVGMVAWNPIIKPPWSCHLMVEHVVGSPIIAPWSSASAGPRGDPSSSMFSGSSRQRPGWGPGNGEHWRTKTKMLKNNAPEKRIPQARDIEKCAIYRNYIETIISAYLIWWWFATVHLLLTNGHFRVAAKHLSKCSNGHFQIVFWCRGDLPKKSWYFPK